MRPDDAPRAFAALASAPRLAVLNRLVRAGPAGMTAGALAEAIGASPSRMSFHLSTLAEAGLIEGKRQARQILYRARFRALGDLARYLLHDCCADHPEVLACCGPARPGAARQGSEDPSGPPGQT